MPSAATTRWQGRKIASRFRAQNVPAARGAARPAGERGQLAVGHDVTAWHRPQRGGQLPLEVGELLEVELDVVERHGLAAEVGGETARQWMWRVLTRPRALIVGGATGGGRLVPDDAARRRATAPRRPSPARRTGRP